MQVVQLAKLNLEKNLFDDQENLDINIEYKSSGSRELTYNTSDVIIKNGFFYTKKTRNGRTGLSKVKALRSKVSIDGDLFQVGYDSRNLSGKEYYHSFEWKDRDSLGRNASDKYYITFFGKDKKLAKSYILPLYKKTINNNLANTYLNESVYEITAQISHNDCVYRIREGYQPNGIPIGYAVYEYCGNYEIENSKFKIIASVNFDKDGNVFSTKLPSSNRRTLFKFSSLMNGNFSPFPIKITYDSTEENSARRQNSIRPSSLSAIDYYYEAADKSQDITKANMAIRNKFAEKMKRILSIDRKEM